MAKTKKAFLFTVDPKVVEEARIEAKACGQSLSHVVEEMLKAFIKIPGGEK
jgi:predicted HicB family RNase H-like nuclease